MVLAYFKVSKGLAQEKKANYAIWTAYNFFFLNATFIYFDFHKVIFIQFIKYVLHIKLWKIWNVMEQSQIFPRLA